MPNRVLQKVGAQMLNFYNRLFPHITRACKGVVFKSVELVNQLMGKAKTTAGLKVFSSILNKPFETDKR